MCSERTPLLRPEMLSILNINHWSQNTFAGVRLSSADKTLLAPPRLTDAYSDAMFLIVPAFVDLISLLQRRGRCTYQDCRSRAARTAPMDQFLVEGYTSGKASSGWSR